MFVHYQLFLQTGVNKTSTTAFMIWKKYKASIFFELSSVTEIINMSYHLKTSVFTQNNVQNHLRHSCNKCVIETEGHFDFSETCIALILYRYGIIIIVKTGDTSESKQLASVDI